MSHDVMIPKLTGASAIAAAVTTAAFWLLTLPLKTFVGAEVVRSPLWMPSQALHVAGALFAVFAFFGIYAVAGRAAGLAGALACFLAVTGTILFLADGIIALAVFPALAEAAPHLLTATGAMNQGIVLTTFITCAVVNMIGNLAFAALLLRTPALRAPAIVLAIGGVLFNLPPGPVPLWLLAAGGVVWSIGLAWCGVRSARLYEV